MIKTGESSTPASSLRPLSNGKSSRPTGNKPASSSARAGLLSMNQKDLRYELKKLDLAKRQYEINHYQEQRKMITRFATKLTRSSSNLDALFNVNQQSNSQQNATGGNFLNIQGLTGAKKSINFSNIELTKSNTTPIIKSPKYAASETSQASSVNNATDANNILDPVASSSLSTNNTVSVRDSHDTAENKPNLVPILSTQNKKKEKKNVKWNDNIIEKDNDSQHSSSNSSTEFKINSSSFFKPSLYEITKRYDDYKLKYPFSEPNVILPQLVSNRSSLSRSNTFGVQGNSIHNTKDNIMTEESRKKFFNLFSDKNPVLYSYRNSKGQPVCSGYDNFIFKTNTKQVIHNAVNKKANESVFNEKNSLKTSLDQILLSRSNTFSNSQAQSQSPTTANETTTVKLIFLTDDSNANATKHTRPTTTINQLNNARPVLASINLPRASSEILMNKEDKMQHDDSFNKIHSSFGKSLTFKHVITY